MILEPQIASNLAQNSETSIITVLGLLGWRIQVISFSAIRSGNGEEENSISIKGVLKFGSIIKWTTKDKSNQEAIVDFGEIDDQPIAPIGVSVSVMATASDDNGDCIANLRYRMLKT